MLLLFTTTLLAIGSPLADGFKGVRPAGQPILEAPWAGCVKQEADPDTMGLYWICDTTLGERPMRAGFVGLRGRLISIMLMAKDRADCPAIRETLQAAYPTPLETTEKDGWAVIKWTDGDTQAVFGSGVLDPCSVTYTSGTSVAIADQLTKQIEAEKRQRALQDL